MKVSTEGFIFVFILLSFNYLALMLYLCRVIKINLSNFELSIEMRKGDLNTYFIRKSGKKGKNEAFKKISMTQNEVITPFWNWHHPNVYP